MRTYVLLFLTTIVVSAVQSRPAALTSDQRHSRLTEDATRNGDINKVLLKQIIASARNLSTSLPAKILNLWVSDVFKDKRCSNQTLCEAGKILKEQQLPPDYNHLAWNLLHRQLASYTDHRVCPNHSNQSQVQIQDFLKEIKKCAQIMYQQK